MRQIILGRTKLSVGASSFGALPIQRLSKEEASYLLRLAYEKGMNYFDTAYSYTDSEEKIGLALSDVRDKIVISTKSGASDRKTFVKHAEESLRRLKTDYIDILQLHNPKTVPLEGDELYEGLLDLKKRGIIRFIGYTNHSSQRAEQAVRSGLYDTIQYPFSYLSSDREIKLYELARDSDVGFIAMKALSGGLISNATAAKAFFNTLPFAVPIWGIQRERELMEFICLEEDPPRYDDDMKTLIEREKKELSGSFCRACGYCMPCPVGIDITLSARMKLLLSRMPYEQFMNERTMERMLRVNDCKNCRKCVERCPYGLDTPSHLKENLAYYLDFAEKYKSNEKN